METNRLGHSQAVSTKHNTLLLDTSFLIRLFERPLRTVNQLLEKLGKTEFIVIDEAIVELKSLTTSWSGRKRKIALQALDYAQQLPIVTGVTGSTVDEKIINYALNRKVSVATIDVNLGRKLRKAGVTLVTCRSDKVVVDGATAIPKDS